MLSKGGGFLGLNDAFRKRENDRFLLKISFGSANFAYHGNVYQPSHIPVPGPFFMGAQA